MAELTPMMRQYFEIKEKNPDCLLFFRLGDFYEMFGDDARTAAGELDLVLTTRDRSKENKAERIPMCGVPYHSSESYVAKLVAKGYKVAICEQLEDPAQAKGLVDRDVIHIVTPGTVIETSMLKEDAPNYLCSVYMDETDASVCFADISTGEISVTGCPSTELDRIFNEISTYSPAEAIVNSVAAESSELIELLVQRLNCSITHGGLRFEYEYCLNAVLDRFGDNELKQLPRQAYVCAVGSLLTYLSDTQKTDLSHISTLRINTSGQYMELDIQTLRNLELTAAMRTGEKRGSLLWVLDKTKTPMGRRLIRSWVLRPLISPAPIKRRLDAVNELYNATIARCDMMELMRGIGDLERLIGKIVYGNAGGRDMRALAVSARLLPQLSDMLSPMNSSHLQALSKMDTLDDITDEIDACICDEPPFSVREGGILRDGFDEEVDRLRYLLNNSTAALADIERRERERTGKKLKVSYNKVFGYYIEIPRSMSDDVPDDYIRKQTLVNCERFITQELKELEQELFSAKDRLSALEYSIFEQLRQSVASKVLRIQQTASMVAQTDVLCSLAETAVKNGYCMPDIDGGSVIEITDGRHPVVERAKSDTLFVPNDTLLNGDTCRTAIITGPNMAGKSTYMRQTALIVLMAQMGSFVPARMARIGVVDRVFTRIGASDDLASGKSTFMVEMTEVADILKNATSRSLILLDEIGRGTSTYDGMSIARAVVEYCTDKKKLGAKTLFATHYHELIVLEAEISGVKNFNISAKKRGGDLIFLRKIVPGGTDDSYGIEVANLAGVPDSVIKRAKAVLGSLESGADTTAPRKAAHDDDQISMADLSSLEVADEIRRVDMNTITPIEALNMLFELKKKVQN